MLTTPGGFRFAPMIYRARAVPFTGIAAAATFAPTPPYSGGFAAQKPWFIAIFIFLLRTFCSAELV